MEYKAKFTYGTCNVCGAPITKGQSITWSRKGGKKIAHLACKQSGRRGQASAAVSAANTESTACAHCGQSPFGVNDTCTYCIDYQAAKEALEASRQAEQVAPVELEEIAIVETPNGNGARHVMTEQAGEASILDLLARDLQARMNLSLGAKSAELEALIDSKLEDAASKLAESLERVTTVRVETAGANGPLTTIDAGHQHYLFPDLLKACSARDAKGYHLNIMLSGPAGTGKTSAAEYVAKALGIDYSTTGALTDSYKLFGFISPGTGEYVRTPFRERWEHGGLFLLDDFDASDPACAVEFNNAFANGGCTFPDGYVPRHKDFLLILTMNTFGHGGNEDYVGRLKQDKAFLDRFQPRFHWPIDEVLELATTSDTRWVKRVQQVRKNAIAKGLKILITPRASYAGCALLGAGFDRERVEELILKAGLTDDQWKSIR